MSPYPKILIDGYNLIFQLEKLEAEKPQELEEARERLLSKLRSYRSTKKISLTVVFDGDDIGPTPRSFRKNGVTVIFSPPPTTADTIIKKIIQSEANPKNITVVTSDRAVAGFAAEKGCQTLSSETFQQRLEKMMGDFSYEKKYNNELSDEELREWVSLFNDSKDTVDDI